MKVMRYQIADYLGIIGGTAQAPTTTYHLLNTGVTSLNENPSPKVDQQAYIGDKNASPTITGYENSFGYDTQLITDQDAITALLAVAKEQKTGTDAEFMFCRVDLYDPGSTDGTYHARQFKVCAEAGEITGEPTEVVTASGTLHQIGDLVKGIFTVATKTFVADE